MNATQPWPNVQPSPGAQTQTPAQLQPGAPVKAANPLRGAFAASALAAGAFSVAVAMLLLKTAAVLPPDPQDDPQFQSLKTKLAAQPDSAEVKQRIREMDLRLRREFFRGRDFVRKGSRLLMGGAVVMLAALGLLLVAPPRPAKPAGALDNFEAPRRFAAFARLAISAGTVALLGAGAAWGLYGRGEETWPTLTARAPEASSRPAPASMTTRAVASLGGTIPGYEQIRRNWPRFRGPLGAGVYDGPAPTEWDGASGKGILWKAPLTLDGHGSPIVWGGRVYLSAADKETRKVFCFDANTGAPLWAGDVKLEGDANAPGVEELEPEDPNSEEQPALSNSGYAASTPATDGNCVCAIFATGDIACFNLDGGQRWARNLALQSDNTYGYASSLDIVGGFVIVQIDEGKEDANSSRLLALDTASGATLWEAKRPVTGSWTSPIVVPLGQKAAVIASGNPWLIAHDLDDGAELWRASVGAPDGAPSPILGGSLVISTAAAATDTAGTHITAVRADGSGDVTATHVAWKAEDDIPDITTPVSDGNWVWTVTTSGMLNCRELASGETLETKTLKGTFAASPVIAAGRLYLLADNGTMIVREARPEGAEIARCKLGDRTSASPAFYDGRIYIRGKKFLYCIGGQ